jgi:hypothetical protein
VKTGRDAFHGVPNSITRWGRCGNRPYRKKWTGMSVARRLFRFGRPACISQHLCPKKLNGNLRIQFPRRLFDRIRRVLPDPASRRFHATRPKPQSRKPAWLPFYTGGDSSLQSDLSAFIFRLPCGQQREQPHRANPTDLRHPCGTTDALITPKRSGIKPFSASTADASLRLARDLHPQHSNLKFDALLLS